MTIESPDLVLDIRSERGRGVARQLLGDDAGRQFRLPRMTATRKLPESPVVLPALVEREAKGN